ncbi:hypothetical protein FRC17_004886 [Serendipita sp. 399]|nr:hypothetical protein FRC17_004886 [Serendipita sp. 399]
MANSGNLSLNGSTSDGLSPAAGMALPSAAGVPSVSGDGDADAMVSYVMADPLSSPDGFGMKTILGAAGVGPLDTIGSMTTMMQGIEHSGSQLGFGAPGMNMGMLGFLNNPGVELPSNSQSPAGPTTVASGGNGNANAGLSAIIMDTTSPSTGSDEVIDDEDRPRGRARGRSATRSLFPAGVGKVEEEPTTL